MPSLTIDGTELNYQLTGKGRPAFVLIHGGCCALSDWHAQIDGLSRDSTVLAMDLRSHGGSTGTEVLLSVRRWAADVNALIEALDLAPAIIVGHSLGSRIASEVVVQRPANAAALVLLDGSRVIGGLAATEPQPGSTKAQGGDMSLAAILDRTAGPYADAATRAHVIRTMSSPPEAVMWAAVKALEDWDRERADEVLAALPRQLPVLAIQSTYHDNFTPRCSFDSDRESSPYLDHLRKALPQLAVQILPRTGHFSMMERPEEVTTALREFGLAATRG
ncbi:alpha/beta hydrolase [Novosphingobium sp. G106]|uniref:alpha/beta fold hydrolase n=1 Tax=Novosphingobium sp. G106 TaxID=2849500 RepID=UPI001C2CE2EC|nr:alpha/beta hydrolase [Novosphingobium sp. G106]MBV1688585.1 alpha/beta hydrolase [Novosphingobium sp. G106]